MDLGCGEGRSSMFLGEEGFNVVGIDLSPTIIKKGVERFGKQSRVHYCVAEITSLPVRSEAFDLVVDITALNNQKSGKRHEYVKEIRRILRKKRSTMHQLFQPRILLVRRNVPKDILCYERTDHISNSI